MYFGLSNLVKKSGICPCILTDHSLIKLSLMMHDDEKGPGFWKFNCSLLKDEQYVDKAVADPEGGSGGSGPPLRFLGKSFCTWKINLYLLRNNVSKFVF